jgi:D-glycero-D-manno-heptose 1,7-bisphosphate phosphatase
MSKSVVFLDRDGVINKARVINGKPYPARSLEELVLLPGVKESISDLQSANFEIVVVTNQPDVARKTLNKETVLKIHSEIQKLLGIRYFYTCFHDNSDDCQCRKPKSGLLLAAAEELKINLRKSYLVGDRWKDVEAGQNLGCKCFFINNEYEEKKPNQPYIAVDSLHDAVRIIMEEKVD